MSFCTSCISLNVKIFIGSKLHTYQNIAAKKAQAGVYLIKESSIEIHILGQDGDFRK